MINLELLARFEAQARADHIERIAVLLTDLDLEQEYSKQSEFSHTLSANSVRLHEAGVTSAYQQACILYALLRFELSLASLLDNHQAHSLYLICLHKCLEYGVASSVFIYLHQHLAGIAQADQVWVDSHLEPDGLLIASKIPHTPATLSLPCGHEGPIADSSEFMLDDHAGFFQTEAGFRHPIEGPFTAEALLREVCRRAWPADPSLISLHPTPLRCELLTGGVSRCDALQRIDLLDARQFSLNFLQRDFISEPDALQRLNADWRNVGMLSDCNVDFPAMPIHGDFECHAGWRYPAGKAVFCIQGQASFKWFEGAVQWNASLQHQDLNVELSVSTEPAQQVQWTFDEQYPIGRLRVGEPLLSRQHTVSLVAVLSAAVSPGMPVIGQSTDHAGDLNLVLQACVNPQSGRLEFQLSLKHSAINCHWQSFDPLRGPMQGRWPLLPERTICNWALSHG